jgi:phosphoglycerate dehydrogenase-like enzyme
MLEFRRADPSLGSLPDDSLTPHMAYVETEQLAVWWRETVENLERWLEHGDWAPERELKA